MNLEKQARDIETSENKSIEECLLYLVNNRVIIDNIFKTTHNYIVEIMYDDGFDDESCSMYVEETLESALNLARKEIELNTLFKDYTET